MCSYARSCAVTLAPVKTWRGFVRISENNRSCLKIHIDSVYSSAGNYLRR
jgi:hypothetical protein